MMDAFDRAAEREARAYRARRTSPIWRRFFIHLRIYTVVNAALVVLWAVTTALDVDDPMWIKGPLLGWGTGVLIHYLIVTQVTGQWRAPRDATAAIEPRGGR